MAFIFFQIIIQPDSNWPDCYTDAWRFIRDLGFSIEVTNHIHKAAATRYCCITMRACQQFNWFNIQHLILLIGYSNALRCVTPSAPVTARAAWGGMGRQWMWDCSTPNSAKLKILRSS